MLKREVVLMPERLSDRKIKKLIAEYVECGSYNAVGKKYGVSATTVKKYVLNDKDFVSKCEIKKEQNSADILSHMSTKKDKVNEIIDKYLEALLDDAKIASATPSQLTTALGTVIDKFTTVMISRDAERPEDPLSKALREEAERMVGHADQP